MAQVCCLVFYCLYSVGALVCWFVLYFFNHKCLCACVIYGLLGMDRVLGHREKDCIAFIDVRKVGGAGNPPTTAEFPYQIKDFCFSPNSKFLLLTTKLGTIKVEGLPQPAAASNSQPAASSSSNSASSSSSAVPPSPSSSSSSSSSVSLDESPLLQPSLKRSIQAHPGNCCCVGVDPSGKFACVGSKDSLVSVWDLEHLASVRTLGEHTTAIRSLSFSWDGSFVASTSYDSSIDVSCLGSGVKVAAIDTQCAVKQVAWQPAQNSRLLAVARDAKKDDKDEAAARARLNRSDFVFLVQIPKRDLTDESGLMSD
mmetsp:Transcript_58653/g.110651  ORF Transcript_58653/g.110651 Transcript_58653/m.110651 type:complete len:312 (+) Transcript_58653:99-1034(+)